MNSSDSLVLSFEGMTPKIDPEAWVAPGVTLIGGVELAAGASVWYQTVLRADSNRIVIGERSNIQDGCAAHTTAADPVILGAGVSVGHRVVLHGCTVADNVLVGMGAVLLSGCSIGADSLIAAGSVVLEGTVIPPRSLVAGVPAKVRRELTDAEVDKIRWNADTYIDLTARHRGLKEA